MSALISSLPSILSARAFSTLRILPRSGRIAWVRRSRPPFELRCAELHAEVRGEPLADIIGGQVRVWILQRPTLSRVRVDRSGERGPEAGQVRATVDGVDVVRERVHLFGEGVVVLERDLR